MTEPTDTELLDAMDYHGWRVRWNANDDTWTVDRAWPWVTKEAEAHGDTLRDALKAAIARPRTDMPADSHEGSQP